VYIVEKQREVKGGGAGEENSIVIIFKIVVSN
jgi:hypothetical protein